MTYDVKDYKGPIKPVWCPGCGDYGVLGALQRALADLEIPPHNIVSVSGIGCSGRFSHYMNTYSLHGTHGRAVPTALGVKAAHPELTVLAIGGDGDGLGIGGGHIPHAARKNVDMTYLLLDNEIYGLTKGQSSPTTPVGYKTKTSPYGAFETSYAPVPVFLAYDISFVARATSFDLKQLTDIIKAAITHKGFSMVYIMSPCRTFPVMDGKTLKDFIQPLPEDHPCTDKLKALEMAYTANPIYTGIFYQVDKPTLEDNLNHEIEKATRINNEGKVMQPQQLMNLFA